MIHSPVSPEEEGCGLGLAARSSALLTIDLGAIVANYRMLREKVAPATCAAVVKADAYGLGADRVAPALAHAGCRHFFVAHLEEGASLRPHLSSDAAIYVLNGNMPGTEESFLAYDLLPVLNSLDQTRAWARHAEHVGRALPAVLQVDTGMARFGLDEREVRALLADRAIWSRLNLHYLMSHLACADEPENGANLAQRDAFRGLLAACAGVPGSLAASSGIFLGQDYHFDLVRPGAALYGIAPQAGAPNPMHPVVRLQGRVVQVRDVPAGTPVGYGHSAQVAGSCRLATVAVGYADGFLRSASNRGAGWVGAHRLPVIGRVSMDSIILDASVLAPDALAIGSLVDLIGPRQDVDAAARAAGTIGYELLTSLGARFHRDYVGG